MPDCSDRAPPQLRLFSSSVPRKLVQKGHSFSPFFRSDMECFTPMRKSHMWRFINQRATIAKPTYATHKAMCNHVQSKIKLRYALSYIHCKLSSAEPQCKGEGKFVPNVASNRKDTLAWLRLKCHMRRRVRPGGLQRPRAASTAQYDNRAFRGLCHQPSCGSY